MQSSEFFDPTMKNRINIYTNEINLETNVYEEQEIWRTKSIKTGITTSCKCMAQILSSKSAKFITCSKKYEWQTEIFISFGYFCEGNHHSLWYVAAHFWCHWIRLLYFFSRTQSLSDSPPPLHSQGSTLDVRKLFASLKNGLQRWRRVASLPETVDSLRVTQILSWLFHPTVLRD